MDRLEPRDVGVDEVARGAQGGFGKILGGVHLCHKHLILQDFRPATNTEGENQGGQPGAVRARLG